MAVVRAPALSLDASGNLGPICYSSWRGLNIARDTWTGTDPNTVLQQNMRAMMTTVVQYWGGSLTEVQRKAWRLAAMNERRMSRVKTEYVPTGFQFFVQLNIQRRRLGREIMLLPPVSIVPYTWMNFRLGYNYYDEIVNLHFENELGNDKTEFNAEVCRAGSYDSGGRHALEGEYRFVKFIQPIDSDADNGVIVGKYYWYRARVMDDYGRSQGWFEEQILVPSKEDGQILENAEFILWTGDNPDNWVVYAENAFNYVTEVAGGCKFITVDGSYVAIGNYVNIESGLGYVIEVNNEITSGELHIKVNSGVRMYVAWQAVPTGKSTYELVGEEGYLTIRIRFYANMTGVTSVILNSCYMYKKD